MIAQIRGKYEAHAEAQIYTEGGSLADRKIYPLFCSVREKDVDYLGIRSQPTEERSDNG